MKPSADHDHALRDPILSSLFAVVNVILWFRLTKGTGENTPLCGEFLEKHFIFCTFWPRTATHNAKFSAICRMSRIGGGGVIIERSSFFALSFLSLSLSLPSDSEGKG